MKAIPSLLWKLIPGMFSMLVVLGLYGCGSDTAKTGFAEASGKSRNMTPASSQSAQDSALKGISALGLDLLAEEPGNNVVAPFSASLSLARLQAGASGETATALTALSHLTGAPADLYPALNQLSLDIESRLATASLDSNTSGTGSIALTQARYGYRTIYLDLLAEHFGLIPQRVDFDRALWEAAQAVSSWSSQKILSLTSDTRLVLGEKIVVNASWDNPFDPALTAVSGFERENAAPVPVLFMRKTAVLPHAVGDGFTALSLPLQGSQQFLILLPDSGRFNEVAGSLTPERLNQIAATLTPTEVDLALPKFTMESRRELPVGIAATKFAADFSALDGSKELFVADTDHYTRLAVTEAGLQAESATLVALDDALPQTWNGAVNGVIFTHGPTAPPAEPVVLGRPFVFAVRDATTGALLFLGRLANPESLD